MSIVSYLKSTILSKIVMAVTGIILLLFLIGHTLGNLQIFIGREVFNQYAYFLQSTGELLWVFRAVMLLSAILHIVTSVYLKFYNLKAKPQKYAVTNYVKATLSSRTMIWTGIAIACFLAYHLLHFTFGVTNPEHTKYNGYVEKGAGLYVEYNMPVPELVEGKYIEIPDGKILFKQKDVYKMVILGFKNPFISIVYIIGVIIVGFHLNHAIQSAFQTLGLNHPRYSPSIIAGSSTFSFLIALGLISIPVSVLLGIIGGVA